MCSISAVHVYIYKQKFVILFSVLPHRRPLQGLMIGCGLPQWVIGVISREGSSDYMLRYSLALLMNLCLRGAGRRTCRGAGQVVLRTLGELLEHEDQEVRGHSARYKRSKVIV